MSHLEPFRQGKLSRDERAARLKDSGLDTVMSVQDCLHRGCSTGEGVEENYLFKFTIILGLLQYLCLHPNFYKT